MNYPSTLDDRNKKIEYDRAIAKFIGWFENPGEQGSWYEKCDHSRYVAYSVHNKLFNIDLPFSRDFNYLMKAWVKFRSLPSSMQPPITESINCDYDNHIKRISQKLLYGEIYDAFELIGEAALWYNGLEFNVTEK